MRIVGGSLKSRALVAPRGDATRPTTDRTRESLFNILSHSGEVQLEGARVIDLFAGSGALGFEAISRGAVFCLFVETGAPARAAIRTNQEALGLTGTTRLHRRSATALGPRPAGMGGPFTLAFLDPPYRKGLLVPALDAVRDGDWLGQGALAVCEHGRDDPVPQAEGFTVTDERAFGDTRMAFLRRG